MLPIPIAYTVAVTFCPTGNIACVTLRIAFCLLPFVFGFVVYVSLCTAVRLATLAGLQNITLYTRRKLVLPCVRGLYRKAYYVRTLAPYPCGVRRSGLNMAQPRTP